MDSNFICKCRELPLSRRVDELWKIRTITDCRIRKRTNHLYGKERRVQLTEIMLDKRSKTQRIQPREFHWYGVLKCAKRTHPYCLSQTAVTSWRRGRHEPPRSLKDPYGILETFLISTWTVVTRIWTCTQSNQTWAWYVYPLSFVYMVQ